MDRYLGSWFDYCEGHIQITNLKLIDMPKLMWQVTSGLNYLNETDIDITTSLSSEKMLLCQNRRKEIVIKITGYSCPKNDCNQVYLHAYSSTKTVLIYIFIDIFFLENR